MAETFAPSSSTPVVAAQVNAVSLEELRSKAENPTTSLDDLCKALKDGLEWLYELQRDKENEFSSHVTPKDEAYQIWKERVSNIEKYEDEEAGGQKKKGSFYDEDEIRRALEEVIKLGKECTEKILDDKVSKRVIKEIGIPSIENYPTLNEAFNDVKSHVLQSDKGPTKGVLLEGKDRMGKSVIMQHLNNYFYGRADFDVVIFIKVADNEDHNIILQKIAERINVEYRDEFDVSERVRKVLENKRSLLILNDDARYGQSKIYEILGSLEIPQHTRDSKVVVTTNPFSMESSFPVETVRLQPPSLIEAWNFFRQEMSPSNSADIIGEIDVGEDLLKFMRTRDLVHLMLSYPMRIENEDFLKQWMEDAYKMEQFSSLEDFDSLRRGLKRLLYDESPLRNIQAVIPEEIINGGRETTLNKQQVPEPIMVLATRLALHQFTFTLTTSPHQKIQNIWFSARDDAEKKTIVEEIRQRHLDIDYLVVDTIDLNRSKDQFQREQGLSDLKSRLKRIAVAVLWREYDDRRIKKLYLVVDGDGDKKLDPHKVILPKKGDTENVAVVMFITTQSSNDSLMTTHVDLTIKTENHLLPWKIFCVNFGNELPLAIREIAVQIVEKCGGHLLAISLMAKSLKHDITNDRLWKLALENLNYHGRELIVNALFFNIIQANEISKRENVDLLRCLLAIKFLDWKITSEDELFDRWFSQQLAKTKAEAKSILQDLVECSLLMQFQDAQGQHIIVPEDIKIILQALGEEILENLSPEGALFDSKNSNLQVLNLPYTHMQKIYDVNANPHYKQLHLSSCELETLPKAIFELQKLEDLSLEYWKKLRELPPLISKLENLEVLSLDGCKRLETLPQEILELQKLKTLFLNYCSHLFELPPWIAKLENLEKLMLSGCQRLKAPPSEIWELHKLKTLSFEDWSQLLELPPQIAKLENLEELSLDGCERLETLPPEIWELQKLKTLSLNYCSHLFELLPWIAKLENLEELSLDGCERLETLPQEILELQELKTLSLEDCSQLLELPPQIAKLENLEKLRLSRCQRLKALPPEIWELQKLETLSLEDCSQLLELPQQIAKLEKLQELRLAGCKRLETLPPQILELPNLKILSLPKDSSILIFPTNENQELIDSDDLPHSSSMHHELGGHGKKDIPSASSAIIPNDFTIKLNVQGGFEEFEQRCQKIMQLEIHNIEKFNLSGTQITYLPESLNFPQLRSLMLGNNLNLMKIPPSFFELVPLLTVLNLSRTSIHELPDSFYKLEKLREFYLRDCELFEELSSKISQLKELVILDLEGTLITHLPEGMKELIKLESLSLSFSNDSSSEEVIPSGVLSQFAELKVLKIDVNSDNQWWSKNIEIILGQIYRLEKLQELDMYIPKVEFSTPIRDCVSSFRFIVGYHKPRMISRVPPASEVIFNESGRSLKFVNGEDLIIPAQVKSILSRANAFFLNCHMKINNLTQFGLKNLKQLRLCILGECNEMHSIVDVDEDEAASVLNESFDMQFLIIFYVKNLRSIIHKPIHGNPIFYKLKLLALHTCTELTTILTMDFLHTLVNLEELIVEDCPKVRSIISCSSSERTTNFFLPKLRKLSLLYVPKLESISNGVFIGANLEQMGFYYCPELKSLSPAELSSEKLMEISGQTKWWNELQWREEEWGQQDPSHKFSKIFSAIDKDRSILAKLATYELSSFKREIDSE